MRGPDGSIFWEVSITPHMAMSGELSQLPKDIKSTSQSHHSNFDMFSTCIENFNTFVCITNVMNSQQQKYT